MSEKKYLELAEELGRVASSTERSLVAYSIFARIAAGIENAEPGHKKLRISVGEAWDEAAERFDGVLKEDPREAFDLALQLTMLPTNSNPRRENILKWVRGDGPIYLAREEFRGLLADYLEGGDGASGLIGKLGEFLSFDFSKVNNERDAFEDANCYLSLATMFLATKLSGDGKNNNVAKLSLTSKKLLSTPQVIKVVEYFLKVETTKWLAEELISFAGS